MDIYAPESWRLERLNELREELHISGLMYESGCWDLESRLEDIRADIAYTEGFFSWYGDLVKRILDAAKNGEPAGFTIRFRRGGEIDEVVDGKPSPGYLLHMANSRYGDTEQRLTWWLQKLQNYGYLSSEQTRQFDVTPPVNERLEKEAREDREERAQWQKDFDMVLELVAKHAEKSGKYSPAFAQRRAVAVWNLAEHRRRDAESIKRWCGDLRRETPPLLPAGAWVRASARLLVQRLRDEVLK